jgi:formiminotetrahydrofolate cyclodeaminase
VLFCKSALLGASLNVYINTKLMIDREYAAGINERTEKMLADGISKADGIYSEVENSIKG